MAEKVLLGDALRTVILKGSQETAADYERQLREADEERKKAQAEFKEKSAGKIKELKQQIKELSAEIKTAEQARKKELGEQIKSLNAEIEQYKTPPVNRFAYLNSDVKAYAGAQLLFKPMLGEEVLKSNNIEFGINEQGRIEVDAEQLSDSVLGDKIRESADYIFGRTRELNEKITQASDINNIIRSDAKNLLNIDNVEKIDFDFIERCHKAYEYEKAERERRRKQIEQRKQESLTGIKVIKEYSDGYSMVEMLPSPVYNEQGELKHHTSLKFESDEMGHCVGRGGYNQYIGKEGWHFYSLRGPDENGVMVPHCTISIENGRLAQIKGNSNSAVKNRYIPDVRDFVKSLDMPIPSSEKPRIGYVDDLNNKEVDLFALEANTRLKELKLSAGDYKGINLANISYINTLGFEGGVTKKDFEEVAKIGKIENLTLSNESEAQFYAQTLPEVEKLVVKGNFALPDIGKVQYAKFIAVQEYNFDHNYERLKRIDFGEKIVLNAERAPILEEGIRGGEWGDTSKLSTKDLLSKMFGSKWVEKHVSEQNGRLTIDTDLNFDGRRLTRFPYDFGSVKINGTLSLQDNLLTDNEKPIGYPECQKMIINNSYGHPKFDRFETLPRLPQGIDCLDGNDIELYTNSINEISQKLNITDGKKLTPKDGKLYYKGDLDFSNVDVLKQKYLELDMSGLYVDGSVKVPYNTRLLPNAAKIEILHLNHDITVPDVTEQVIVNNSYATKGISNIEGKNLKSITYKDYVRVKATDLQALNKKPDYYGEFVLCPTEVSGVDLSALKLKQNLRIYDGQVFDNVAVLPQCQELNVGCQLTDTMIAKINPQTQTLLCQNLFDADMLPSESQIKYVGLDYRSAEDKDSIDKFVRQLSARGIMIENLNRIDYSQDLSDMLVRNVEMRWVRDVKNISKLPQMEKLSILSPDYGFEKDFLKDATPHLKELKLSYMREPADFSALSLNVRLESLSVDDSCVQNNILRELPTSVREIKFLRCNNNIDFEAVNNLPNLEKLEISQMNIPANAFDKVDPERLKHIEISGNLQTVMRVQEIKAIHQLSPSEENDKIKNLHQWLTDDKNNIDYQTKQVVFYSAAADILKGKHPQPITEQELAARVKGVEKFKLDSCAKIIMANELNHKSDDDKIGRTVLEKYKGKKAGYYTDMSNYYDKYKDIGKLSKILKAAITHNVKYHPDFDRVEGIVDERLKMHISSLQAEFNRGLSERNFEVKAYENYYSNRNYNDNSSSFNRAVNTMRERKR